ncbi:hypothetical protein [Aquimarina spongiae]|nr:hypothetical protein [Aquimarina spongiae]
MKKNNKIQRPGLQKKYFGSKSFLRKLKRRTVQNQIIDRQK